MKKIYFILLPFIFICCIIGSDSLLQTKKQNNLNNNVFLQNPNKRNDDLQNVYENLQQGLKCKSCHEGEFPSKNDPLLRACLRNSMLSNFHFSPDGPDVVVIDDMSENYTGVVFSHKIHAQMSEMSTGCSGCHHYNTTGRVLSCLECHENNRKREDVTVPDLKAAYHRQCLACHKQWNHDNGCNTQCHSRKVADNHNVTQQSSLIKKSHPPLKEPSKMVWETNSDVGKIVTFFHNEHNQLFKIKCVTCHLQDNCIKCHEKKPHDQNSESVKIKKSFEDHHKACITCHKGNNCQKCHKESVSTQFNHAQSSGWALKPYHSKLTCAQCHGSQTSFKKLDRNCTSCHKNFLTGNFDHKNAGLILSENHKEIECKSCHTNSDFAKTPTCATCHDDKSYPSQLPGSRR